MSNLEQAVNRFEDKKSEYIEDLKELVRIPSVSADPDHVEDVKRSAAAVADLLRKRGLENVEILEVEGAHPYAYGDWCHAEGQPTLVLYAHHDVQPIGDPELWKTEPFEPTLGDDGRLYGRGAADDKAGVVVVTSAIDAFLKSAGKLPVNVKVIIEGEEEIGSEHLAAFLKEHRSRFDADALVLTDTGNFDTGIPGITTALRGLVALKVTLRGLRQSLHSGSWGGAVPDAAVGLSRLLATLTDENGDMAIEGMMDSVRSLSAEEREKLEALDEPDEEFRRKAGIVAGSRIMGRSKSVLEKLWHLPAISVNALEASSMKAARNVIVDTASARIGIRTVPNMEQGGTLDKLEAHLKKHSPWGMELIMEREGGGDWWHTETTDPAFGAALEALEEGYGKPAVIMGCGGSIPFVEPFSSQLGGVPSLLIGIEDPYTNAHSENESLHLGDWEKSTRSIIHLFQKMSR